ncbi:unnamed protein product [Clonostachys solani]|uniref:Rhodopsin domain-containing protein n=1 Tax=Clonostachys solani TaxID=160281 RepID=A0A9P0ERC9_9HYPO|nr:unnamed protein product [Clonostachys solani]
MDKFESMSPAVREMALQMPGMVPPAGLKSNLVDPPNGNKGVIGLLTVCIALTVSFAFMRFYARTFIQKKWHLEDYLGFAALGPYAGGVWVVISCIHTGGFLVHQWNIRVQDLLDILYILLMLRISYALQMLLAKTAIMLEWSRIFVPRGTRNAFYWVSRALIVINALVYIIGGSVAVAACIPAEKLWHPWVKGHCSSRRAADISTAWFNLFMDVSILLLPQSIIWKLQMTKARKIGIALIFSVGLLVVACAIGRTYSNMALDYSGDTAYDASINTIWGFCEMTGVMIVFYAPAIPKVFSEKGVFSRVVVSVRSWKQLSGGSSLQDSYKSSEGKSWPHGKSEDFTSGAKHPASTDSEVELVRPERARVGNGKVDDAYQLGGTNQILKVTRLEHNVAEASKQHTGAAPEYQKAWVTHSREGA